MCANYRKYDQKQFYFTIIHPEMLKKENPLVAAVEFFVDNYVNVEQFSGKVKNDNGGAPAIHPKMMLKILFYSYANSIYSSREIEKRLSWDPYYIYLAGNQSVDHSTICNFILKYSEEIKNIFTLLVYLMTKLGYVTLDFVAIDGTKIKANVSKEFSGTVKEFKDKQKRIENKIEQIINHTLSAEQDERCVSRIHKKIDELQRKKKKIDEFLKDVENCTDMKATQQINLTDKDARKVKDNDKYMGYNCHIAVDANRHVIISNEVFNTASDRNLLRPMIEEIRTVIKEDTEIGFDSGYFSSENLKYCVEQNLNVYLPEGKGDGGKKRVKNKTICSRDCRLEIDGKVKRLTCPGEQIMETTYATKDRNNYYYKFYPKKDVCDLCTLKEKCYGNAKKKRFVVKKEYFDALAIREKMTKKLLSKRGKQRIADRACVVEHVFGEIKELFNFRRFLHRTLRKVRVIWNLICIAYNLRKLAKLGIGN